MERHVEIKNQIQFARQALEESRLEVEKEGIRPASLQVKASLEFLDVAEKSIQSGKLNAVVQEKEEEMVRSYEALKIDDKEPSFRCVASYKDCKRTAKSIEDKILCGIALTICFAKEIIPLTT